MVWLAFSLGATLGLLAGVLVMVLLGLHRAENFKTIAAMDGENEGKPIPVLSPVPQR